MKSVAAILAIASTAAAFAPSSKSKAPTTVTRVALDDLAGSTAPLKRFDPLGLAQVGSEQTFAWFQAAELKHSRAAMLATTGFIVQAAGIHFPGMLSKDISFESLSGMNPVEQWAGVPDAGKWQIILTIFIAEIATEAKKPHYMMGGDLPTMVFPPIDFSKVDAATLKTKRSRELNNGRLAMIGIMSFISEYNIPGSVPVLSGLDAF
ncbi:protein fucoxanthin chlorophyll a/c protein [Phaeodactylum tricornutum CCAP 1055/1]|jgi:hypothetical protein|uniref:Protein fucoxanthin chlorophyll a/c protein n=2 Tax=Phaeodactylum tricornutum TaxID=2850 RepID=B7FV42_PHATC|nr:protein fucoxanthin chlorophyll a/c protein [Phaeodactylum tricornutum CCAP 1055/1]EEC49558.1 protein fucoxanthin chlorophyll a/c protein [Phaeodactylum tricornutum CCAP 1055/1]|eukprot:XP_002178860.1 protein fucoxanthin chlorophyll a/c protein [Phaeodactylum tricornutum CCAP 1055/1]